jgi:phosphonate transport system substrate-binding protein
MKKLVTAIAAALVAATPARADGPALTFGVVPQQQHAKLTATWTPFVELLARESGVRVELATAPSMEEFHRGVLAGKYDFGLVNPLSYVLAEATYTPIARQAKTKLVGLVLVPTGSPAKKLCDLRGATLAVPSRTSFAAAVVPMTMLQQECGLDLRRDVKLVVANSHENAVRAVIAGQAQAVGLNGRSFDLLPPEDAAKVRILAKTRAYSNLPIVARRSLPPDAVRRVRDALVRIGRDPANAGVLEGIGMASGLEVGLPADWDDVRRFRAELTRAADAVAAGQEHAAAK